jgi:hypothetical protein
VAVRQLVIAIVEVYGSLLMAKVEVQSQDCTTCGIHAGQSGIGAFFVFPNSLIFSSR